MEPLDVLMAPAQPHSTAHTPEVSLRPGNVCNKNPGIDSLESIAALATLRSSSAVISKLQFTDSWEREKVIAGTELTTRSFCQF